MNDSFETSGLIKRNRDAHIAWFSLADHLSNTALAQMQEIKISDATDVDLIAALLFMRGVSGFQAAIVLAERGFSGEARTLARGCFETAFYLGALHNDHAFLEDLLSDDADRRGKIARALMRLPDGLGLEAEQIETLRKFDESIRLSDTQPKGIGIYEAAKRAGLADVYDTYYRGLSNDASHPSITSLYRYVESKPDGELTGLTWRRDSTELEDTVNNICTAAIYIIHLANGLLANAQPTREFQNCWENYKTLVNAKSSRAT